MKMLTIKVDENSRKGKAFLDFIEVLYSEEGNVQLSAIDGLTIRNSVDFECNSVAESRAKYKTSRKTKKEIKEKVDSEEGPYNPEFVKMVLDSAKSKNRTVIDPNGIWGSLGLK